ncbi:hypothetical protein SAMN05421664_3218 [Chryseobacterium soldanellicola]|uniref:Uncharacterized protein n=1 Tax=Chryseobacterium soldanellicola TaxID=311333 RepID=A0A1H1FRL4_9FLAO|nr:hypothetical protein [Chryseobacterium soldanellicola]SDR03520.1 hypothetical protein SAMN05421664_3218 [Chryseobacterium soldanellicola]
MKKKIAILLILGLGVIKINAQIGVNTSNPQAAFHVDGAKDNPATGVPTAAQQTNDVAVTQQGRVGIGTIAPTNSLEVDSRVAGASGVKMTRLPSATTLATDASGNVISGNTEDAGVSVTKLRLAVASPSLVLNSGSGAYSFRYTSTNTGGTWQIRINTGATRQFNIWDTEYSGQNGTGASDTVWQLRTVKNLALNTWTALDDNIAGGANEYNVYHVYDLSTGTILRLTVTLSSVSGIRESMILEEF